MARLKITYTTLAQDLDQGISIANLISAGERNGSQYEYDSEQGWIVYSGLDNYQSLLDLIQEENSGRTYSSEAIE